VSPRAIARLLLPLLALAACAETARGERASLAFPGEEWERASPESQGVDPEKLAAAVRWLDGRVGPGGAAELVIVRNGRLIWEGPRADAVHAVWSVTKIFTTSVLGALVTDGRCELDTRAAEHVPGLADAHDEYGDIRLRQLAAMTSGYDGAGGSYAGGDGSGKPFAPAKPLFEPGEKFAYWDDAMNQLGHVLTWIAGESMASVFERRIAKPIGMRRWKWGEIGRVDGVAVNNGSGNLGRGIQVSAREIARLGHLYLNRGRWDGRRLLDERFVEQATSVQVPADLPHSGRRPEFDGRGVYGLAWWANGVKPDGKRMWPSAPRGTYCARGDRNNRLCVIPEWNVVVARLNAAAAARNPTHVWDGFFARLGAALEERKRGRRAGAATGDAGAAAGAEVAGEPRVWHPLALTFRGPRTREDGDPNPFRDFRLDVELRHGGRRMVVPGYFAADGNAADTGADAGDRWRAHFVPDEPGEWRWRASFRAGRDVAMADDPGAGKPAALDGASGALEVGPAELPAGDPRGRGWLRWTGERHLRFAGTGEPFLKGGAGSPENLLAFADFDQTPPRHRYAPHVAHWREGDPTWRGGRGRGLVGALRWLAEHGMSSVYFLSMNVGGDGDDVWPWTARDARDRYDVSKLAQWERVFSHMDHLGLALHVITQETENDRLLDGGALGPERRLYYRELVARFGHHLALVWNLGEENRNSDAERKAFARHLRALDPWDHPIAVHTYPGQHDEVYEPLLGFEALEVASLQVGRARDVHAATLRWVERSARAGRPWAVALDEIGPASDGVAPDREDPDHDRVRTLALWGHLMAGGAGVEWYFGYRHPHHDLDLEDFASRARMWAQTRVALAFFREHLPFAEMQPADALVSRGWCLAKPGEVYAVYLPRGGTTGLELPAGRYTVRWYDPRAGGALLEGDRAEVAGGGRVELGRPPRDPEGDWAALVRRATGGA
jgi:CubicO group peptidase (beta-lactamase class C family)